MRAVQSFAAGAMESYVPATRAGAVLELGVIEVSLCPTTHAPASGCVRSGVAVALHWLICLVCCRHVAALYPVV
jgi:hypothetical protein